MDTLKQHDVRRVPFRAHLQLSMINNKLNHILESFPRGKPHTSRVVSIPATGADKLSSSSYQQPRTQTHTLAQMYKPKSRGVYIAFAF